MSRKPIELFRDEVSDRKSAWDANNNAQNAEEQGFPQNHLENLAALRSESNADAEFSRAARDRIGHEAVKTYGGQEERESSEKSREHGRDTFLKKRAVDLVRYRCDPQRVFMPERLDFLAKDGAQGGA